MENLLHALAHEDTVLFIGSGISTWSGLPSWYRLIELLADELESNGEDASLIREEATRGDLLQAASYGFDKLTKPQIGQFIRRVCQYGSAKPHEIHRRIVSLGPKCFITTNYDNLIEESLKLWQPDQFIRPPITNRMLTEMAEIVHAQAVNFIYKPHGDASDSESIVLSREHYRQLLPGGERQAALETLKMILASRRVVYLGFGLRDPDFLFVRDILTNIYKGGTLEHFAVMADLTPEQSNYWKRNYGIQMVNYNTKQTEDKRRDHSELLNLLERIELRVKMDKQALLLNRVEMKNYETHNSDFILSLARHAARLSRFQRHNNEVPMRAEAIERNGNNGSELYRHGSYSEQDIDRILISGPQRWVLIGSPGSGKTYSMQKAAYQMAENLSAACLNDAPTLSLPVIPLYVDLKLYQGDLFDLVRRTLPQNLDLSYLIKNVPIKLFLDSFNEMPRSYIESGRFEEDFRKFESLAGEMSIVIGSRTTDGLSFFNYPIYKLEDINEDFLESELKRLEIHIEGRFKKDLLHLLKKPFYFRLFSEQLIEPSKLSRPTDIYRAYFDGLSIAFHDRYGFNFELESPLSTFAYEAIESGFEAQPTKLFHQILSSKLLERGILDISEDDLTNWLVSRSLLIPYTGARIGFFHQSVTEYLAAQELAKRYVLNPKLAVQKLTFKRWDYVLFLTLGLLPKKQSHKLFRKLIEVDTVLAVMATKYLEDEETRNFWVSKLLEEILDKCEDLTNSNRVDWALREHLPVSANHELLLRQIAKCGDMIGGAAVHLLVTIQGVSVKEELLNTLVDAKDDYNYCVNGVSHALERFITYLDLPKLVSMIEDVEKIVNAGKNVDKSESKIIGFTSSVANLLGGIDLDLVVNSLIPIETLELSDVRQEIFSEMLMHSRSSKSLYLASKLLLLEVDGVATSIYFIAQFGNVDTDLDWNCFDQRHIRFLISKIESQATNAWYIRALKKICKARADLQTFVESEAAKTAGMFKALLLYCRSNFDEAEFAQELAKLLTMNDRERGQQPTHYLDEVDEFDWSKHTDLFIQLLRLRDTKLAKHLLNSVRDTKSFKLGSDIKLDIDPIEWWLDWLSLPVADPKSELFWFKYLLSEFFANNLNDSYRAKFLTEFNKPDSPYRQVLADWVLVQWDEITTNDFSDDAIQFLLDDLKNKKGRFLWRGHLLGRTATEQFVNERLLPMEAKARGKFKLNLNYVLQQVGSRHGRRYISSKENVSEFWD